MLHNKNVSFVGRDDDLEHLRDALRRGSILLTGPRRIGKTELLKELIRSSREDLVGVLVDLEGAVDVETAIQRIVEALEGMSEGGRARRALSKAADAAGSVRRLQVGDLGLEREADRPTPWVACQRLLEAAVGSLAPRPLVLLLDEVPWWLDELRRARSTDRDVPGAAGQRARTALAELRYLRQRLDGLRMVMTGSIGLGGLAAVLGASAEINDLHPYVLPPLGAPDGEALFEQELTSRGMEGTREAASAAHALAGGSPHWIKQLAAKIRAVGRVGPKDVEDAVERLLEPQVRHLFQDEATEHFSRRHTAEDVRVMSGVLEAAAQGDAGAARSVLVTAALAAGAQDRAHAERQILELVDEFYLRETADRSCCFVNPVFRRWWLRYGVGR